MLKSVTVTNHLGESLELELEFPEKSGFFIQEISGLGPSKATINATEMATDDGALFNSARVSSRNIVLTLGFLDAPNIETTRQLSYKYFPIKRQIHLMFKTDNRICGTNGYVESNEPNIFSSQETTQISIICPDPYFYSEGKDGLNETVFSGIEAAFEFPFSNESLTEDLIEFGIIRNQQEQNVFYSGDSEIGIFINIHAIGSASGLKIVNVGTRETMSISSEKLVTLTGSDITIGDEIIISTVKGKKYISLIRNGVTTNILNCLDRDSAWFQLSKGDNIFAYVTDSGSENLQFSIENQLVYEGV